MTSSTPTRPDAEQDPTTGSPQWQSFMSRVRQEAVDAWATGRHYYETSFVTIDLGQFSQAADAAGALEAIESVGWRLAHVGYVSLTGMGQATGGFDSAPTRIRGIYLFRRPDADG
jgi:hypothetical protein